MVRLYIGLTIERSVWIISGALSGGGLGFIKSYLSINIMLGNTNYFY